MASGEGLEEVKKLKFGGFSDQEVEAYKGEESQKLLSAGFSPQEVKDYWGDKDPDTTAMKDLVKQNIEKNIKPTEPGKPKEATGFLEAFEAGWDVSVTGLVSGRPDVVLPQNAGRAMNIASMIGSVAGDLPAMIAGGAIGAVAGGTAGVATGAAAGTVGLPVVGTVAGGAALGAVGATAGGWAGTFALPAGLRKVMMDHYEKGDVKDAADFWDRLSAATWEATKAGGLGVATFGAGKVVGGAVGGAIGSRAGTLSTMATEVGVMTTLGAAMEGHSPEPDDFINNALLIGGLHGVGLGAKNLRRLYAEKGVRPAEVVEMAKSDPVLLQEVVSEPKPELGPKAKTVEVEGEKVTYLEPQVQLKAGTESKPVLFNEKIERTDAEMKMLSRVGETVTPEESLNVAKEYKKFVDDLSPIREAVDQMTGGKKLDPNQDPYTLGRIYRGWHSKFARIMDHGTIDFKDYTKETGEGFKQIMKDIPNNDRDGFVAYGIAKRAIEKAAQGKETGVDIEAAKEVIKTGKQFEQVHKRLVEFSNRNIDYAVDSGILNKDTAKLIKEANQDYFPFHRIMEQDPFEAGGKGGKPFKMFKGSSKQIEDPIATFIKNQAAIIKAAERNRVYEAFVKVAEENPDTAGKVIKKSAKKLTPIELKESEIGKVLKEAGIEETPDNLEAFTIFRAKDQVVKENEIVLYRDGKAETYKLLPEYAESLKALDVDPGMTSLWFKVLFKLPTNLFKNFITLTPDFQIRNAIHDQFEAGIQGKKRNVPFATMIQSYMEAFKLDKQYKDYFASGGASGQWGEIQRYIDVDMWKINEQTKFMDAPWGVIKNKAQALAALSQMVENIPRYQEFKRTSGKGAEAALRAREVTLDFARGSAKSRVLNQMIPFFNVGVQGFDKTFRTIKDNPAEVIRRGTAIITVPTLALWWANRDDSRYQATPQWEKDAYFIIPTDKWELAESAMQVESLPDDLKKQEGGKWYVNNGTTFKIVKPRFWGLMFGSMPERVLDAMYRKHGKDAFKEFDRVILESIMPNGIPTVVGPYLEQKTNRVFYTGKPIVPDQLKGVLPEYQYTEYTSETAKQLSKIISAVPWVKDIGPDDAKLSSPLVIDNYLRGYGGTLGKYAIDLADKGLTVAQRKETAVEKPAKTLADYPIIKAFILRTPRAQSDQVQDFNDAYQRTEQLRNTIQKLKKDGNIDEALKLANDNIDNIYRLDGVRETIKNLNTLIQKINISPDYTADEKRQLIDGAYYQMIRAADMGNQMIYELEKGNKK